MWEPKPDSAAARLDEDEYLARVAADLTRCEPLPMRPNGVTQKQLGDFAEHVGEAIGKLVKALERRVAELEQKQLKLGGCWKVGERYAESTLVTFQGGLWLSLCETGARPGASPSWRLAVKRGDADAKL